MLAVRIFELPRIPGTILWEGFREPGDPWPAGLAALAEHGVVKRSELLDACVARILRGGKPAEMTFCLAVLRALDPGDEERRARIPDWLGMAADGTPMVASYAQKTLTELDRRGELPDDALVAMSEAVLFRREKALVRAQLVLVDRALKRTPGSAERLLPVVGEAFGQADTGIQDRALKLVARHLGDVGDAVREDLALAADRLSPARREEARALLGVYGMPDDEPYEEVLPPVTAPGAVAPAPGSVAELVEEVLVVMRSRELTVDFERVVDGMVRHGAEDRGALAAALREAMPNHWWAGDPDDASAFSHYQERYFRQNDGDIDFLVAAVATRLPFDLRILGADGKDPGACPHEALSGLLSARLREVAYRLRMDPPPFLLATPTRDTGALDPGVLVERLREYGRLGAVPGPVDFGQALLRVRRGAGGPAAEDAAARGTAEGDRLAAWLRGEGPELPALRTPGGRPGPDQDQETAEDRDGTASTENAENAAEPSARDRGRVAQAVLNPLRDARDLLVMRRTYPRSFHWLGRAVGPPPRGRAGGGVGAVWGGLAAGASGGRAGWGTS
ncbi:DUF6493 family protein, partial [Streptomyces sp. NPDC058953]|uniref:DUF6493 family protein n=1 Tax=Streptomyces sp. NPDC058953 TaxID=3346676 RepID=UPI0036C1949F